MEIDWFYYRKIILDNSNYLNIKNICVTNYDIPKNCAYYLLREDQYVIGYSIKTNYGEIEMPVFDHIRGKLVNKLHKELIRKKIYGVLIEIGFPSIVSCIILKYL